MTVWLSYKSHFTFMHKLDEREGLVDKACTNIHTHKDAEMIVSVLNARPFLDFKRLKTCVEFAKTHYTLGTSNTDKPVEIVAKDIARFTYTQLENSFEVEAIGVTLWETEKYGVDIIWNP